MKFTAEQIQYLERVITMDGLDIVTVDTCIKGDFRGDIGGDLEGNLWGNIFGDVFGKVLGTVDGKEIT